MGIIGSGHNKEQIIAEELDPTGYVDRKFQVLARGNPRRLNHNQVAAKKIQFLCQLLRFLIEIEKPCRIDPILNDFPRVIPTESIKAILSGLGDRHIVNAMVCRPEHTPRRLLQTVRISTSKIGRIMGPTYYAGVTAGGCQTPQSKSKGEVKGHM
jgi:hypothetical protein